MKTKKEVNAIRKKMAYKVRNRKAKISSGSPFGFFSKMERKTWQYSNQKRTAPNVLLYMAQKDS